MGFTILKTWIGCTLLAVLMLTLDCGPICGFDSETKRTIETFQSSCHQESNSNEASGCEWDSGSITFLETDTNLFKLLNFYYHLKFTPQTYIFHFLFSIFKSDLLSIFSKLAQTKFKR